LSNSKGIEVMKESKLRQKLAEELLELLMLLENPSLSDDEQRTCRRLFESSLTKYLVLKGYEISIWTKRIPCAPQNKSEG
jgi:hypothetical protein